MPNKNAHDIGIGVLAAGTLVLPVDVETKIYLCSGMLTGLLLTPDLDLSRYGYWKLYGKLFKHRGISHVPVVGTITRVIYLGLFPVIVLFWADLESYFPLISVIKVLSGLVMADILHLFMDKTWSWIKRKL